MRLCYFLLGVKAVSLLVLLFVNPANAAGDQCYRLVSGKQLKMCRAFEGNLNRYCDEPPMVCSPKVHKDFSKDFSVPKWESVDSSSNWHILEQLIRSRTPVAAGCDEACARGRLDRVWEQYRSKLEEGIKAGTVRLHRGRVDMNHDGVGETVYRLTEGTCIPEPGADRAGAAGTTTLMVYDEGRREFDPRYAQYLKRRYDVLYFRGRAHLTSWQDVTTDPSFMIFDTYRNDNPPPIRQEFGVHHRPLCHFRY